MNLPIAWYFLSSKVCDEWKLYKIYIMCYGLGYHRDILFKYCAAGRLIKSLIFECIYTEWKYDSKQ